MKNTGEAAATVIEALAKQALIFRSAKNPRIAQEAAKLEVFCLGLADVVRAGHRIDLAALLETAKQQHRKMETL